jgi:hypothetical protein
MTLKETAAATDAFPLGSFPSVLLWSRYLPIAAASWRPLAGRNRSRMVMSNVTNVGANMKHVSLLPLVFLLTTSSAVFAQEPSAGPETSAPSTGQGSSGGHHGMMTPNEQLARMTKRYNLSADRQNEIKPVLLAQQARMQELRGDSSLPPDERKAKMQSILNHSNTRVESILNDDQKKQFEQDHQSTQ